MDAAGLGIDGIDVTSTAATSTVAITTAAAAGTAGAVVTAGGTDRLHQVRDLRRPERHHHGRGQVRSTSRTVESRGSDDRCPATHDAVTTAIDAALGAGCVTVAAAATA